jgi:hypothetical protein
VAGVDTQKEIKAAVATYRPNGSDYHAGILDDIGTLLLGKEMDKRV